MYYLLNIEELSFAPRNQNIRTIIYFTNLVDNDDRTEAQMQ
jgi:hypothetical protein